MNSYRNNRPLVFVLGASSPFGQRLLDPSSDEISSGKIVSGEVIEKRFPDGEPYVLPGENVRGRRVCVVQSLYTHPREKETMEQKLTKLFIFGEAAYGASAEEITAIIPYLAFSRQDRKTESRAPLSARLLAKLIEAANFQRVVTMDVHQPAIQSAYRIQTDFLLPFRKFAQYIVNDEIICRAEDLAVIAPDAGALDRASALIEKISDLIEPDSGVITTGYADKQRISGSETKRYELVLKGPIDGRLTIIPDDETVTGGTMLGIARRAKEKGAGRTVAFVTHGKMTEEVAQKIQGCDSIDRFLMTDTICHPDSFFEMYPKLGFFSVASIFRRAILLNHERLSLSEELF